MKQGIPFPVKPLPYGYNALEPAISAKTMTVHHDKLYKNYVDKLNASVAQCPEFRGCSVEQILRRLSAGARNQQECGVHNSAGGVYNHEFFWTCMAPCGGKTLPKGRLATAICRKYGSLEEFKKRFKDAALQVFGSGWLWLCADDQGCLHLVVTANQDTPFQCKKCACPILVLDLWEHAYFLDYLNLRADYIDAWWSVVNWEGLPY